MKEKRKCILCPSHEYAYCGKCKPKEIVETWRFIFDSENCRDIYKILENYVAKKITALEARQQLDKYDLPNINDIQPILRKKLEDIYYITKDNYIQDNISVTDKENEVIEELPTTQQTKPRRKRYSRRNSN